MLKNKVAVVTGGSRGIGRAISLEFARQGASVAILYAGNEQAALETAAQIREMGQQALTIRCDVASWDETKESVATIIKTFGQVDILVNNAGITRDGLTLSMSEENFDAVVDTNLKGAFHMIRHLFAPMMKRRSGRIINISSVAGLMGNAGQINYASAKAGLIGMTKTVAKELASRGITCNAIAPGFIETDMTAVLSDRVKENAEKTIPMGRMGKPEDIAAAALFLASDAAAYITGEVIRVDGGLCM
ncbi:MAG: 3-oxoacyl-[acyl-carrier-protein] reductase [Ruminococcaceae bacterium]|nr:3-oxoacyl-[acyl-carrier-protein] reductase [Oscillospiraceae bacterium]